MDFICILSCARFELFPDLIVLPCRFFCSRCIRFLATGFRFSRFALVLGSDSHAVLPSASFLAAGFPLRSFLLLVRFPVVPVWFRLMPGISSRLVILDSHVVLSLFDWPARFRLFLETFLWFCRRCFTACWVLFLICLVLFLPAVFVASCIVPTLEVFVFCCTD
jgi:hypothetical protein